MNSKITNLKNNADQEFLLKLDGQWMTYLIDNSDLLRILRSFPPNKQVTFGGNICRIAEVIFSVSESCKNETEFTIDTIIGNANLKEYQEIAQALGQSDTILGSKSVINTLDLFLRAGLVTQTSDSGHFKITKRDQAMIGDLFSIGFAPRWGRTGFLRFLLENQIRTVQWCCLQTADRPFIRTEDVVDLCGLSYDDCKRALDTLSTDGRYREKQLTKSYHQGLQGEWRYEIGVLGRTSKRLTTTAAQKMLEELLRGYKRYKNYELSVRDTIVEILKEHKGLSGADLCALLKDFGFSCTQSNVYNHLAVLKKGNIIEVKKHVAKLHNKRSNDYALVEKDASTSKEQLLKEIKDLINQIGVKVGEDFFLEAREKRIKPFMLRLFYRQLCDTIIARDTNDFISWQLWNSLLNNLDADVSSNPESKLNSLKSKRPGEGRFCISPMFLITLNLLRSKGLGGSPNKLLSN